MRIVRCEPAAEGVPASTSQNHIIAMHWLDSPASLNPLLVEGEGSEEEGAHVEVDKGQAEDRIVAKGAKNRQ